MHSTDIDHKADLLSSLLGKSSQTVCEIDKAICGKAYDLICQLLAIDPKGRPENVGTVADKMEKIIK